MSADDAPAGCPSPATRRPAASPDDGPVRTYDDNLAIVGQQVPEFGGLYVDPATKQWVVQVTDGEQETATRAKLAYDKLTGTNKDVSLADYKPLPRPERVKYPFLDLYRWYRPAVDEVHAAMDVRTTDINEGKNRLTFGVADVTKNRACVDAALAKLGIPKDAYEIVETGPISFADEPLKSPARSSP